MKDMSNKYANNQIGFYIPICVKKLQSPKNNLHLDQQDQEQEAIKQRVPTMTKYNADLHKNFTRHRHHIARKIQFFAYSQCRLEIESLKTWG